MTILRIGLVTEGPTDQVVLEEFLAACYKILHPEISPVFINLHPRPDRTSSSSRNGGWETVFQWCRNNSPKVRHRQFFGTGLFADSMDDKLCDIILVHMDSDICEMIGDKSKVLPIPTAECGSTIRGRYIRETILEWLWPNGATPDDRHIPAPAVASIEAWLVAALGADEKPEDTGDISRRLAEIYFPLKGLKTPADAKCIKNKNPEQRYRELARHPTADVQAIIDRCPHFKALVETLLPEFALQPA